MSIFGDWLRHRKARYQRDALKALAERRQYEAEIRRHDRRAALASQPVKEPAELMEQALLETEDAWGWDRLGPWKDLVSRWLDFSRGGFGVGNVTDHRRRHGADFPFFATETELGLHRDASRLLVRTNPNAEGLLNGVRRYTIGTGATIRVAPKSAEFAEVARKAQAVLDEFVRRNRWALRQREFVTKSMRDGESWLRLFPQSGDLPVVRDVWPEQVRQPTDTTVQDYGFGVKTDPDDAEEVQEFAVWPANADDSEEAERVPAEEVVRSKLNVDRGVRRGLPDFYAETLDTLDLANDLARKMGAGSARQAAIAYIREHAGVKQAQLVAFNTAESSYTRPDSFGGPDHRVKRDADGLVIDTNPNTQFKESPYNGAVDGHLNVFQMLMRRAHAKYNAPEWLGTSYSQEVNFASSLTAESPFVLTILEGQEVYADHFRDLFERVLAMAALAGLLPADVLDCVEVKVTLPNPRSRDLLQESQRANIDLGNGTLDPQTACEEAGREWPKVTRNRKQAQAEGWQPPQQGPKPGEPGASGGPPNPLRPGGRGDGASVAEAILEALVEGFTGTKTDSIGREYHFVDGKRVAGAEDVASAKAGGPVNHLPADAPHLADTWGAIEAALPDELKRQPGALERVQYTAKRVYYTVWNFLALHGTDLAADVLDVAQDYESIKYAKNGPGGDAAHDPFAVHLGIPYSAVSVAFSKVVGAAYAYYARKKGMSEEAEGERRKRVAMLAAALFAGVWKDLGVVAPAPTAEDVLSRMEERAQG